MPSTCTPHAHPDLGAGTNVTRFIGLAAVGNAAKQEWLGPGACIGYGCIDAAAEARGALFLGYCPCMSHHHTCLGKDMKVFYHMGVVSYILERESVQS